MTDDIPTHIAYDLGVKDDGIRFTLSTTHREFLKMLAMRGGETIFDYRRVSPKAKEHLRKLVDMKLVGELPIVGSESQRVTLTLTDIGRNIVTLIRQSEA